MIDPRAVAIAGVAVAIAACSTGSGLPSPSRSEPTIVPTEGIVSPSGSATAQKCANETITFDLSFIPNVQHAGFLVASKRGYYADEGLDVQIRPAGPGVDIGQEIASGRVDMGQVDYVDIAKARAAGAPIKAIAQTYKLPYVFWYATKDEAITTVAGWKGHTLGSIQGVGSSERDAMLMAAGLDRQRDVRVVDQDFATRDVLTGKVDIGEGFVYYHPAYLGGTDARRWPDDFDVFYPAESGADLASQTVAARGDFLADHTAAVKCFLRASVRGWRATFQDPQAAVDDVVTFIPENAIPTAHQRLAINDVLTIVGSGVDDDSLLQPTPEKYQATVGLLRSLGSLANSVAVEATYAASYYEDMGPVAAP